LCFEPENPIKIYKLSYYPTTFPLSDLYIDAVQKLVDKKPESLEAEEIKSLRVSMNWQPQISESRISGNVIYIDRFQNAITNIRKEAFEKTRNGRSIRVAFRGYNDVNQISRDYSDVIAGEKLCLFNSSGYLEIAINKGNAAGLLNIRMRDTIQIDFL
jgi:S-adenosyl-L-methionine hydrolase (adenosine-forming)